MSSSPLSGLESLSSPNSRQSSILDLILSSNLTTFHRPNYNDSPSLLWEYKICARTRLSKECHTGVTVFTLWDTYRTKFNFCLYLTEGLQMPRRPAIPAAIRRQVAVESGHRCAVCGESCPLELAHIIPWHLCRQHKREDLVYLCANCHQRADNEHWGEEALRWHKQNPAVHRHSAAEERRRIGEAVTLRVELEIDDFRDRDGGTLPMAIAGLLRLPPERVRVSLIKKQNRR